MYGIFRLLLFKGECSSVVFVFYNHVDKNMKLNCAGYLYLCTLIILLGICAVSSNENEGIESEQQEEQCESYSYKVIKPLLEYIHQVQNQIDNNESKDKEIREFQKKLAQHDSNVKIIDELKSQIDFYKITIERLTNNSLSIESEINRLAEAKTMNYTNEIAGNLLTIRKQYNQITNLTSIIHSDAVRFQKIESQLIELNVSCVASLKAKDDTITKHNIQIEEHENQLKKNQNATIDQAQQLSNFKVEFNKCADKLKVIEDEFPNSCIPFEDSTGIRKIKAPGIDPFDVLCDSKTAGPGWIVMQQRLDGKESFYRNWTTYRDGFGSKDGDFFIGLEKLHHLTNAQHHELYIHMEAFNESVEYAYYDKFIIANETNQYQLSSLGTFTGNATDDRMRDHEMHKFTTYDRDNDELDEYNCAVICQGGWWYNSCTQSHLNGIFYDQNMDLQKGIFWYGYGNTYTNLKQVKMLIRPL